MAKKRILFINNSSRLGIGTSVSLLLLLKYLNSEFDCAVVSDGHSNQLPDSLQRLSTRHYALPDRLVFFLPSLIYAIFQGKYDLVYANGSNERSRGAFWAAKLTRRPLVWHIRESLTRTKYAGTIRFADVVIANSRDTADRLREFAHVTNPTIVHNGVEMPSDESTPERARTDVGTMFRLNSKWLRIINIGRVCPDKNQEEFLRVAHQVVPLFPETYFIMVGAEEAPYLNSLRQLVSELRLEKHVVFSDYRAGIITMLQGCDVMLHVSKKESQGRVVLEAMAARLPVVAFDVGGVRESVMQGETGYLRQLGDTEGLAIDLGRILADRRLARRLGEAGYARVRHSYSAERTASDVKKIINGVLAGRHA